MQQKDNSFNHFLHILYAAVCLNMAVDTCVYCFCRKSVFLGNPPIFFSLRNIKIFYLFGAYVHVELERIWEEVIMAYFEVLFQHFPGWTKISQSTLGRMIAFVLNEI